MPQGAWPARRLVGACTAVGALTLALPASLTYDAWAWLVWGREVVQLSLDTTAGASWKPLPVLVTAALSTTGEAAPELWMLIVRAGSLLGIVAVFRLAARLGGRGAGLVAVAFLILTPDSGPRLLLLVAEGHTAPLVLTLSLWAVDRHLDGHRRQALVLATAAGLLRPEIWPFLVAYGAWLWWREPSRRILVASALAVVPVLWFGGDWWGSGSPWQGAEAAAVVTGDATSRFGLALGRAARAVIVPAWVAAAVAVLASWREGDRSPALLGGAALAWLALVVGMTTLFGYAALSRFVLAASGALCVLGGAGVIRAWAALRALASGASRAGGWIMALAVVSVALPLTAPRVMGLADMADRISRRAGLEAALVQAVERAGGAEAVRSCGAVGLDPDGLLYTALAWELAVPLGAVGAGIGDGPGVSFLRDRTVDAGPVAGRLPRSAVEVARSGPWVVHATGCPILEGSS